MNINATLFVQALSFAFLIWFAVKFIWPPLNRAIDERNKRVATLKGLMDRADVTVSEKYRRILEAYQKAIKLNPDSAIARIEYRADVLAQRKCDLLAVIVNRVARPYYGEALRLLERERELRADPMARRLFYTAEDRARPVGERIVNAEYAAALRGAPVAEGGK